MNPKHILITGASGLIGTRLTQLLLSHGYKVTHLGRTKKDIDHTSIKSFTWDIEKSLIEPGALEGVDAIVNLAGAGVADQPWTEKRKKVILESRTKSAALLFQELQKRKTGVTAFVSASAMGYYGMSQTDNLFVESDAPGNDFLATVTSQWENEVDKIASLDIRVVKLRISVVLAAEGGALQTMSKPVKWMMGSALGSGKQFVSWIHIEDMCGLFMKAIEDNTMRGAYNAASSNPVTNKDLTKAIAKALHKPIFLPAVPAFVLRLFLGEMADMVLKGINLSAEKIKKTGFVFKFDDLEKSLKNLLSK